MGSACTRIARAWSSAISCTLSNHELQKISKAEECRDSKLELRKLNQSGNSLYRPLQYGMYFFVYLHFLFCEPKITRTHNQIGREIPTTTLYVCLTQTDRKEETRIN